MNKFFYTNKIQLYKEKIFLGSMIFLIGLWIISDIYSHGNNNMFLSPDASDTFMDYFNMLANMSYDNPYVNNSNYPAMCFLIYGFFYRFVNLSGIMSGHALRADMSGNLSYMMYCGVAYSALAFLVNKYAEKNKIQNKKLFIIVMMLLFPFVFVFERGNIIIYALVFLMIYVVYYDSKSLLKREIALIALACAFGIKIYPCVFILFLLQEKNILTFIKTGFYSIIALFLPFCIFGGMSSFKIMCDALVYTSGEGGNLGYGSSYSLDTILRAGLAVFHKDTMNFMVIKVIVIAILLIAFFVLRERWKKSLALTLMIILVPGLSYSYVLIFLIIPLLEYLGEKKEFGPLDVYYMIFFVGINAPIILPNINYLTAGSKFNFTYGMLLQHQLIIGVILCFIYEIIRAILSKKEIVVNRNVECVLISFIIFVNIAVLYFAKVMDGIYLLGGF